jgi:hypothetical protein
MIALLAFMAFVRAQAPAAAQVVAVKAGRLFDAKSGSLTSQVILINGDRITDVGPANRIRIQRRRKSSALVPPRCCRASSTATSTSRTAKGISTSRRSTAEGQPEGRLHDAGHAMDAGIRLGFGSGATPVTNGQGRIFNAACECSQPQKTVSFAIIGSGRLNKRASDPGGSPCGRHADAADCITNIIGSRWRLDRGILPPPHYLPMQARVRVSDP